MLPEKQGDYGYIETLTRLFKPESLFSLVSKYFTAKIKAISRSLHDGILQLFSNIDELVHGQVRVSNELRKVSVFVSASRV
jgi:hypothetical protein